MSHPFTVLIPARLASTRLPNKALADIAGLPMIVRVAQQALKSNATRVVIATDHPDIQSVCKSHQLHAVMTRPSHLCGSDRLAEACDHLGLSDDAIVVNVQGDEPLIDPRLIQSVAQQLITHPDCNMSTAAHPISKTDEWQSPHIVKVVLDINHQALYFSRSPIPYACSHASLQYPSLRHIGIYGYRVGFLKRFAHLAPAPIEQIESLEQLRALWYGERITVHISHEAPAIGVDTLEDLIRVRAILADSSPSKIAKN